MKSAGAQPNKSLIDGVHTLQALAARGKPIGVRALARDLGLETTRVNRLLKTLTYLGIVRQDNDRKYAAGSGMLVLASQSLYSSELIQKSLLPLSTLHETGLIVAMGMLWRDNISYAYHAKPSMDASESLESLGHIGHIPATETGLGMMLLSDRPDSEIRAIYKDKEIPNYPKGVGALLADLAQIRKQGYAYILSNPAIGHHTVAVLVGNPTFAAIGLSGAIEEPQIDPLLDRLYAVSAKIAD